MWSAEQNISRAGKGVFHEIPSHLFEKSSWNLYRFFFSSLSRKYVHAVAYTVVFVGPARFLFNAYVGCNATCPLSSSCSNKNDAHGVA